MGKGFFAKLAVNNLKRNDKKYIPYYIASTIMISVYFMVLLLIYSPGLKNIPDGQTLRSLFQIGFFTLCIFVSLFMFYINSFLIKQRKKELGLYGILGLEKRHVGRVLLWENIIVNGSSLITGILSGCVFGWLIFLLLLKCIHVTADTYFIIPPKAIITTVIYFAVLFTLIALFNVLQVRLANPIDLLKSDHAGEKKTRFILPITLFGLTAMGSAYYMAWNYVNSSQAISTFFVSVVLVILATNALFTTGSIALLKTLKCNKKIYYKSDNFVSIAGMFHRMKQNASGLATICILSTMVLVTVSSCVSLYLGQEDLLRDEFMDDIVIRHSTNGSTEKFIDEIIYNTVNDTEISIENQHQYKALKGTLLRQEGKFVAPQKHINFYDKLEVDYVDAYFISLEEFNRISQKEEVVQEDQVLLLTGGNYDDVLTISTGDKSYQVAKQITDTVFTNGKVRQADKEVFIVMKDLSILRPGTSEYVMKPEAKLNSYRILNINGGNEDCYEFSMQLENSVRALFNQDQSQDIMFDSIYIKRFLDYSMFGGLLFLGVFFTILFLCATVIIIYFKQVSEGFEDKERFETLQKVGMDDLEVKRTINKQILIVFFLPLLAALCHLTAASKMIIKMLGMFGMFNVNLSILCIIGSSIVFTIVYIFVYRLTARTYCRIVKW